jgi:hypothetical protein
LEDESCVWFTVGRVVVVVGSGDDDDDASLVGCITNFRIAVAIAALTAFAFASLHFFLFFCCVIDSCEIA